MSLVSLRRVELAFGARALLGGVTLHIDEGERVALLGRNGVGKSSLLSLVAGRLTPDAGEIDRRQGLRIGVLDQEVPPGREGRIREVVTEGASHGLDEAEATRAVEEVLSRMELDPVAQFATLSAGLKRRVLLARALACGPELLILDEPTNHLDVTAIAWLEELLSRLTGTLLFVTHDRAFLDRLATRVVELDRGRLLDFPGSYRRFVEHRDDLLLVEERAAAELDKKLASEEAWIRRGIKARGVRNMGRVRALEALRRERRARREQIGTAKMSVHEAERSGKLVVESEAVSIELGGRTIVRELTTLVLRGDRVGILGPNGCGKTTLLRALLGDLSPSSGRMRLGSRLHVAYFDQLRGTLEADKTVTDNISGGAEHVEVNGRPRHVLGYLEDWLFSPQRGKSPVSALSGGERNRLLLAKLFLRPSNVLVLDEPTNDLDVETLELLEERLAQYAGTVLVVSHDRTFLDNVVTDTLAYEGDGRFVEYAGGYSDYKVQKGATYVARSAEPAAAPDARTAKPKTTRKLSYKEQRELESLPTRIEELERAQAALQKELGDPAFYQRAGALVADVNARLLRIEADLESAYLRWQELDDA